MTLNKHVLIYTEYGDTCDFKARVFGVYDTFEEAKEQMKDDVQGYLTDNPNLEITEEHASCILVGDEDNGCQWQILTI